MIYFAWLVELAKLQNIPVISMNRGKCEWRRDCASAQREVHVCSEDTDHGDLCVFVNELVMSLCFSVMVEYVCCEINTMLILLWKSPKTFQIGYCSLSKLIMLFSRYFQIMC